MRTVALGEIAEVNPRDPKPKDDHIVSFVGMAELSAAEAVAVDREEIAYGELGSGYTQFKAGDILAAKITPCWENGKVGQAMLRQEIGVGSSEFHVVRPGTNADARYLMHFLRTANVRDTGTVRMTGSGGQRRVPVGYLRELNVPLPPLGEQRRIADILDRADALVAKRRKVIEHLDALGQSIFHDMFGDLASRQSRALGEIANLRGGRNLIAKDASEHAHHRVLKISAVTSGTFEPSESKPLPADYEVPEEHLVRAGDLLMSRANTTELVGATAFVDHDPRGVVLPDKIWRFDWLTQVEPMFFHALLSTDEIRQKVRGLATGTGGSMKNVAKAKLLAMEVPMFSLVEQREFVRRMMDVGEVCSGQKGSLSHLVDLRRSLAGELFGG